ncbi:glycosyltransferase family 2 protein [Campylobacter gastrosuis]|uniref:Glycosyltransferase family 2 protein n=1 Tax=Campylobacter gastrosuis TaxID=2974576 RepID=A0ABT7HP03_9BACT|nr:glycosyltransferase family 2 protein [Campylobacter gastrosuis]MDL0088634.1 glycosyltransferase family 2 protein [Campylobacter gastrosuis]
MIIIFPMAGLSSRFAKAGYKLPKYMLDIKGGSVFYNAVNGFKRYFNSCKFLFIYRDIMDTKNFIKKECAKMNLKNYEVIELKNETQGQAHTVQLGLEKSNFDLNDSILIFNIDTFRPNFKLPSSFDISKIDGYLEVFEGDGENWSFVLPKDEQNVIKTAEKERISPLCSSGLYYFNKASDFISVFDELFQNNQRTKGEFYIAPLYNKLITQGKIIKYFKIQLNEIIFCGTPKEYEDLIIKKESNV